MTADKLSKAEQVWTMWHQKDEPRQLVEAEWDFPDFVFHAGQADTIVYSSDKWEDDGDFHDYVHDFDSRPSVYAYAGDGNERSVARLLGVRDLSGDMPLTVLAIVKEFIYTPLGHPRQCVRFADPPLLCTTNDKKTLVILSEERGAIFVRGGTMHVTERGIVN